MNTTIELLKILNSKGVRLTLDGNGNLLIRGNKKSLDEGLVARIKAAKEELVSTLREYRPKVVNRIPTVTREQVNYPTSFAQQRLWFIDKMEEGARHFNMPQALRLRGNLDTAALNTALNTIVERHETLRTCFEEDTSGEPRQKILPPTLLKIDFDDLSGLQNGERELCVAEKIVNEASASFDLARDLMIRARLLKLTQKDYVLLVTMHHIASDGWSMGVLINEFSTLYRAAINGIENSLQPIQVQYLDYAEWQRRTLTDEALEKQLEYWRAQLKDIPEVHSLPLDFKRPKEQSFNGTLHSAKLSPDTTRKLKNLCDESGATIFMGLHAAFSAFLGRLSNSNDIVMGTSIANREQAEISGLIGFFVNNLVLRTNLENEPTFMDLLAQCKRTLLDAYAHQQVPFERVVEQLQPQRNLSHSPLFQVMLILQNNEEVSLELPDLTMEVLEQEATISKYDLTLNVNETANGLELGWEFNSDIFAVESIARMAEQFNQFVATLVSQPTDNLHSLNFLSSEARNKMLLQWNANHKSLPENCCVHHLFEQQVEKTPDAIAVVFNNQDITYRHLNHKANQLAHFLRSERAVSTETPVGICLERGADMIIAMMAILKAGGAYIPLDPEYPQARLDHMLEDSQLRTVITHCRFSGHLVDTDIACCLDSEGFRKKIDIMPASNPCFETTATGKNLAYLIYTSGSTGKPKASLLEHRGLCNLALGQIEGFYIQQSSRVLQFASPSFDAATSEVFMTLLKGATLVVPKSETVKSADALSELVQQERITHATLPPALLPFLDIELWQEVSTIIVAGDSCALDQARRWSQGRRFINAYGPSEATVCATLGEITAEDSGLHIGKPIQNVQVYVLNNHLQPAAIGCSGELYIGGMGLSRGYLNRDELTAEKFVVNPFYDADDPASSKRLYRTGDLARWITSGKLEFLGRMDHQIKIRGFRVELGEIENTLREHEYVKDALVVDFDFAEGDKRLICYYVSESEFSEIGAESVVESVRAHLKNRVPDYMLPGAFVALDAMPLTTNGKIDRKSLPEPDLSQVVIAYVKPKTKTEVRLCEIWEQILEVERVGTADNFFHRGGHSLLVLKLLKALESEFGVRPNLKMMFEFPDLLNLAAYVDVMTSRLTQNPETEVELFHI